MSATKKKRRIPNERNTSKEKASLASEIQRRFMDVPRDLYLRNSITYGSFEKKRELYISVQDIVSLAGVALNDAEDQPKKRSGASLSSRKRK